MDHGVLSDGNDTNRGLISTEYKQKIKEAVFASSDDNEAALNSEEKNKLSKRAYLSPLSPEGRVLSLHRQRSTEQAQSAAYKVSHIVSAGKKLAVNAERNIRIKELIATKGHSMSNAGDKPHFFQLAYDQPVKQTSLLPG